MTQKTVDLDTTRLHPGIEDPAPAAPVSAAEPGPASVPIDNELLTFEQLQELRQKIVAVLCSCFDPEIPVNIYELGLIYDIDLASTGALRIRMTLTSPACPVAGSLPAEVQRKLQAIPRVGSVQVDLVWDPPWDKNRMSEAAKLQLGIDD
jgi:FeS assembly SUF system protein